MKKISVLAALLVFSLIIVSCGGSGTGNSGGETTTSKTYLAYTGSVHIVDPANPLSPIEISSKPVISYRALFSASYNSSTHFFSNLRMRSDYWIDESDGDIAERNGGKIYKLNMAKDNLTPSPIQISNITDACDFIYSYNDNVKEYVIIKTAGDNKICYDVDDQYYLIHSDMSSTDAPISLKNKKVLSCVSVGIFSPTIDGFLIDDNLNKVIKKCDVNLSNCEDVGNYTTSVEYLTDDILNGNNYLCVDGFLYKFNGTNLAQVDSINCGNFYYLWVDSEALYAVNSGDIVKIPFGSATLQTIYSGGDIENIEHMTNNYLIVRSTSNVVMAVKKDGTGTPINIIANSLPFFPSFANKFYFTDDNETAKTIKACEWVEGASTPSCVNGSYWAGFSIATSGNINASDDLHFPLYRLLRVDGATIDSNGRLVGGTLKAVNPSDNSTTYLGTIPSKFASLFGVGIGNNLLLMGRYIDNGTYDVFFVDLSKPNSLKDITNTPDKNEFPIY